MVKIKKIQTAAIDQVAESASTPFEDVESLTDAEWVTLEQLLAAATDLSKPIPFTSVPADPDVALNDADWSAKKLKEKKISKKDLDLRVAKTIKDLGGLIDAQGALMVIAKEEGFNRIKVELKDQFMIIVGTLPQGKGPVFKESAKGKAEKEGKKGFWSVPIILPDGRWANFIAKDETEATDLEGHLGNPIALVAKIKPRKYLSKDGTEKEGVSIFAYRDSLLLNDAVTTKLQLTMDDLGGNADGL